jgi:hypothetical protein
MTQTTLAAWRQAVHGMLRDLHHTLLTGPQDDWLPTLVLDTPQGMRQLTPGNLSPDALMEKWPMTVACAFQQHRPSRAAFWMTLKDPDRGEGLLLEVADPAEHETWWVPIVRHADRAPELGTWVPLIAPPDVPDHNTLSLAFRVISR